jgi:hypothetical protein
MNEFTKRWIPIQESYHKGTQRSIHPRNWPGGNKKVLNTCAPRRAK